jgi:hypothetical protein
MVFDILSKNPKKLCEWEPTRLPLLKCSQDLTRGGGGRDNQTPTVTTNYVPIRHKALDTFAQHFRAIPNSLGGHLEKLIARVQQPIPRMSANVPSSMNLDNRIHQDMNP